MRGWLLRHGLFIQVVAILVCDSISSGPASLRKGSKCMRHYYVETIHHPKKICERKNVLLARCEGNCGKSRTNPRVSFSPVLYQPFKQYCMCCKDSLSIMKAVALRCKGGEIVFATYRYILRCSCEFCGG